MVPVPHYDAKGKEVDCAVGNLKLVDMNSLSKEEKHKMKRKEFVIYNHFHSKHFKHDPLCC